MSPRIGFLHTSPVHVATFDRLVRDARPDATTRHTVDEEALATARRTGPDSVTEIVQRDITDLAPHVDVIVCTCSTLGDVAEGCESPVPVLRVDRPMAGEAVRRGRAIGVVAALESTLSPTLRLLEQEAARHGVTVTVETRLADDAWAFFESGEEAAYLAAVARSADDLALRNDVVALAQASMLGAESLVTRSIPVISSPPNAVAEALRIADGSKPTGH